MPKSEITVEVFNNFKEINQILNDRGYNIVEKYTLFDCYFSKYPLSQLEKMSYIDILNNSILLRECPENSFKKMVFKKKEIDENQNVIAEEKISTYVNDIESAKAIFLAAGFCEWCNLTNKSYVFEDGEHSFVIQVVDDLGIFLELEENEKMQGESKEKISQMTAFVKTLGLNLGSDFSCKKNYLKFQKELKHY